MPSPSVSTTLTLLIKRKRIEDYWNPYFQLHGRSELLLGLLGNANSLTLPGGLIGTVDGVKWEWALKIGGVAVGTGRSEGLESFLDNILNRCQTYREKVVYGVYGFKNDLEWDLFRLSTEGKHLIAVPEELVVRNYLKGATVGRWRVRDKKLVS